MAQKKFFLIDFDGVVSKNSTILSYKISHYFINKYLYFDKESYFNLARILNSWNMQETIKFMFDSLGIGNKVQEFFEFYNSVDNFNGEKVIIEEQSIVFFEYCRKNKIDFRILSVSPAERIMHLLKDIDSKDIYNTSGFSKSSKDTFIQVAKSLNIDVSDCIMIDDDPHVLRAAKMSGITTVVMKTDFFSKDIESYKQFIDYKIDSLMDLIKIIG